MNQHAEYCHDCSFPFKQMGACPKPGVSLFWAFLSLVPYLIPIFIFVLLLVTRKKKYLRSFSLLATCYAFGDKIIKNIIRSPRPLLSCKKSFGMPSSHMAVMVAFCYIQVRRPSTSIFQKLFWVLVTVLEGYSRVLLNYHTFWQVIGGTIYSLLFSVAFDWLWRSYVAPWMRDRWLEWQRVEENASDEE